MHDRTLALRACSSMQLAMSSRIIAAAPQRPARLLVANRRPCALRMAVMAHAGLFGKGRGEKEEAARKALQDALAGKKDPFAAAEERARRLGGSGDGGSGKGGGGGGGGGGFGGGFDFNEWGDSFRKGASNFFKTVATILLFAAMLGALALWKPLFAFLGTLVRMVLRLDGNPRAKLQAAPQVDLSKKEGLGSVEEAIMGKYAAAGEEEEEEEESGED